MKSVGIIAEYNPFHNGHRYQLEALRKTTSAEVVVVVMSGNFLQRGEPACYDKWTRANWALQYGADLVVELPVCFSTQAADFFARGAVQTMAALQVDALHFGVESGKAMDFLTAARWFVTHESMIKKRLDASFSGSNYGKRLMQEVIAMNPEFSVDLAHPNNTLGFAYCKEIVRQNLAMAVTTIDRKQAQYHETVIDSKCSIASATAIRRALMCGERIAHVVPELVAHDCTRLPFVNWERYWVLLQYQLTLLDIDELECIYELPRGLASRMKQHVRECASFREFVERLNAKHLTVSKLQRICTYILLNLTQVAMQAEMATQTTLHVLGFTATGQRYLRAYRADFQDALCVKLSSKNATQWALDIKAGQLYQLADLDQIDRQDFGRSPIRVDHKENIRNWHN